MSDLLDIKIKNASKDFDNIKQAGCKHDREKALSIDVDKILGIASEFEFDKTDVDEIKDEVEVWKSLKLMISPNNNKRNKS